MLYRIPLASYRRQRTQLLGYIAGAKGFLGRCDIVGLQLYLAELRIRYYIGI